MKESNSRYFVCMVTVVALTFSAMPFSIMINDVPAQLDDIEYPLNDISNNADKNIVETNTETIKLIVATSDVNELANCLSDYEYEGCIGAESSNSRGIAFPVIEVPLYVVDIIAELPSVLDVQRFIEPQSASDNKITDEHPPAESNSAESIIFNDPNLELETYHHGAEKAWENGFTGEGVNVGLLAAGCDMGHFELEGKQAIVNNVSSPYYNYPIAFDPVSMSSYISNDLMSSYSTPGMSWYSNTSTTDLHMYHTVQIDGVNDFWDEFDIHGLASSLYPYQLTSERKFMEWDQVETVPEFDLEDFYITSDEDQWYVGFNVGVQGEWERTLNVSYGLYIDSDMNVGSGGSFDPRNNYITTWNNNLPEHVIYLDHTAIDWGFNGSNYWCLNDTVADAVCYDWNGSSWDENTSPGIEQAYGNRFIEMSIPKGLVTNTISLSLFTVGDNQSHAQDSLPTDSNVSFPVPEWSTNITNLESFVNYGEPYEYIVAGIPSMSGNYHVGLHPDNNLFYNHYGRPVATLVTDMYVSGEYNAVYIDLDNDKDFTDEVPCMEYGAYNDTYGIGPHNGSEIFDNDTLYHDGKYYNVSTMAVGGNYDVFNEVLMIGAVGGETDFTLFYQNITTPPTLQRNYTAINYIENETVEGPTFDGQTGPIWLDNGDIIDCSLYIDLEGEWIPLEEGPDYTINYATGEIGTPDIEPYEAGWMFHAYYNYSADFIETPTYTLDAVNGTLVLDTPLNVGDDLIALNYSYVVVAEVPPYILFPTEANVCQLELRDWACNRDIDVDGATGDGQPYPDISGGMVYFIGDGSVPIPYSDIFCDRNGIASPPIPGNGELVAFYGDFNLNSNQGTLAASGICGEGIGLDSNGNALVRGMAPDSKLISMREGNTFEAWYFAAEGYDGIINSGDEANIISLVSNYNVDGCGWDIYTRTADYIGMNYSEGNTIFVSGTGDNGYGYGMTTAPAASTATITAGQGTQFDYRNYNPGAPGDLWRIYADGGPNSHRGEVLPQSDRGPGLHGQPEPDVITAGAFIFGNIPLNINQNTQSYPYNFNWHGGQWAWDLWSGGAAASSSTAGMLALIYHAYYQPNGEHPDLETAKSLLRSGADNMNYDILTQGAGYTNVDRSTEIAANIDGLYLEETSWTPGDYRGIEYEEFTKLIYPGDSADKTFLIENRNSTNASTIEISDEVYQKTGEYTLQMNITKIYDSNMPGIINIEPFIEAGTELLKVSASSPWKASMQNYMAELFDWTDVNGNNWLDFTAEQNRIEYVIGSNNLELRFRDPQGRTHDGLALQIKDFGGGGYALTDWTITLEFYNKLDWNWMEISDEPSVIAAGGSESFTSNISIPEDAAIGAYEGAIHINEYESEELVATGVGQVHENVTFKLWFHPASGAEGIIDDNGTMAGNSVLVPKSTVIHWNGTILTEGIDYELSGTGGSIKFCSQYPAIDRIPTYAPYFNISYLSVDAELGIPVEEATWAGQTSIPNLVKDKYTVKLDGIEWDETSVVIDEVLIASASGTEKMDRLANFNTVKNSLEISYNGSEVPAFGGEINEMPVTNAFEGQENINLTYGNIDSQSLSVSINDELIVNQIEEVSIANREEVEGLNSTAIEVQDFIFAEIGPEIGGSIWNDTGTWYGKMPVNSDDIPEQTILTYIIYKNGVPLIDGIDFTMHWGGTHGMILFYFLLDPSTETYSTDYTYYNNSLSVGQLAHAPLIPDSFRCLKNGIEMEMFEYAIDIDTGLLTLASPLGPDEIIESSYEYYVYLVDYELGTMVITDGLHAGDNVSITYSYYNYLLKDNYGLISFAAPVPPGTVVTANYSFMNYVMDREGGVLHFTEPIYPGVVVTCSYWHYSSMISVFINVAANTTDFTFGGNENCNGLYNNNELITNSYDQNQGDSRYYYVDIPDSTETGEGHKLMIDVNWTNNNTDIDVFVYSPGPADTHSQTNPLRYGPYVLVNNGGSIVSDAYYTSTDTPRECISVDLKVGFNLIIIKANNLDCGKEIFSGRVGTIFLDPSPVNITTGNSTGKIPFSISSNIEWSGVEACILASEAVNYMNLEVYQDDPDWANYDTFAEQLASGTTTMSLSLTQCEYFNVHIWGQPDAPDLDLGIFLDGKNGNPIDGITQVGEFIAYGADFDADEEVTLLNIESGNYLIKAFGFSVTGNPGHYDMQITKITSNISTIFNVVELDTSLLPAGELRTMNISWNVPVNITYGTFEAVLFIGPINASNCCIIPITLHYNSSTPIFSVDLQAGWNLISFPLEQADTSLTKVLSSIAGQYDAVKYYDATDINDPWKTHRVGVSTNDLVNVDHKMGIWINMLNPANLTVEGDEPTSTNIPLYAGWNLVSYPSLTHDVVANALWGTGADSVEVFDPAEPYLIREVGPTYLMQPGEGYWVHVPADTIWTVDW